MDQLTAADADLQALLGYSFATPGLLGRALTHKSVGGARSNERLEFLGDRVLGMIIAEHLHDAHPGWEEGRLSVRFNGLVRRETLAEIARAIALGRHLRLGKGEEEQGGRDKPALLADALEAVIAAIHLDGGLAAARAAVLRLWAAHLTNRASVPRDAKTALQELTVARGLGLPAYREAARSGPDHAPHFMVEVRVGEQRAAWGEGASKRLAEQAAAQLLLDRLEQE